MAALTTPHAKAHHADTPTVTFAKWLAEDPRRDDLPFAVAWRTCFGADVPTRLVNAPAAGAAPTSAIVPTPVRACSPKPARAKPTFASYACHTLREAYAFADPDEYVVSCVFHRQTARAHTLEEAAALLEGDWCGICRLIH
jgi:hypothetical protein